MTTPVRKLGRRLSPHDRRTLWFWDYFNRPTLPPAPASCDWTKAVAWPWGMMANDTVGDCVLAAAGHLIESWTYNAGDPYVPPDAAILAAYSAITGYNPADPSTDIGTDPLSALKYWRATGISGHQIGAFAATNAKRQEQIQQAIYLFGGSFLSFALPAAAQGLAAWDIPQGTAPEGQWEPGSWGGHEVCAVGYSPAGVTVITWGAPLLVSWNFLATYCDESYAVLSNDLLNGQGQCPAGFDLPTLVADLAKIG